jgi:hypothetical protein
MSSHIMTKLTALMALVTFLGCVVPLEMVSAQGQSADINLTSADITFSKDHPSSGEIITITAKIHNRGPSAATNVVVSFNVSNLPLPPTKTIATIVPTGAQDTTHQWPTTLPGTFTIKVSAKADQSDPDSSNNQAERTITVGTVVPTINVTATISPDTIESKDPFTVNGTALMGTTPVNGGDVKVEVVQNGYANQTKTKSDGSFEVVMAGPTGQGLYNIKVTVSQGAVSGSTQVNLTVLQPDMTITTFKYTPKDPIEGDVVKFTIGVQNLGNGTAKGVMFQLKIDVVVVLDKDEGDFSNGQTKTVEYSWKSKKGSHSVIATVDVNNTIEEIKEDNNVYPTQTVTVKAKSGGKPGPSFEAPLFVVAVIVVFLIMRNGRFKVRKQER